MSYTGKIGKRPRHGIEESYRRAGIRTSGYLHKNRRTSLCQPITRRKFFDLSPDPRACLASAAGGALEAACLLTDGL